MASDSFRDLLATEIEAVLFKDLEGVDKPCIVARKKG